MSAIVNRMKGLRAVLMVQMLLAFGIVSNFAKEMVFAYYYGTSQEIELFRIAFGIPYSLFQTFASAMVGVLLPIYLNKRAEDEAIYTKLADQSQQFLFLIFVVGVISAPLQARMLAPGYTGALLDQLQITIIMCWLFYLIVSQTFPIRLYLQSENKMQLIAATSLILTMVVIAIVVPTAYLLPHASGWLLIVAHLIAAVVVLSGYLFIGRRAGFPVKNLRLPGFRRYREGGVYGLIAASFLTVMITSMQRVIDRSFASVMEPGTVASLEYAYNIYTALGLLIGTTAVLSLNKPIAERFHGKPTSADFVWLAKKVLPIGLVCLILAGITASYSDGLIRMIYEHGMFTSSDTHVTGSILTYLMLAFPFMLLGMVLMQVMYAANAPKALLALGVVKLLTKFIAIYWLSNNGYAMFGLSNLLCEAVGCLLVLVYLYVVRRNCWGRHGR